MKVYHVSSSENENVFTGILSPETMNSKNPEEYLFMNSQDTDFLEYETDGGYVIVTREDADKFEADVIR